MKITGTTKIYGIFGYPVKHTASPAMQNAAFEYLGLDCVYVPFEVAPEKLSDAVSALRTLGVRGVNVTIPHKETIIPFLDELSDEASSIGAVNTVINNDGRLTGYNTDGLGFIRSLENTGRNKVKGKKMVLFGAGGAGRAVGIQSLRCGVPEVVVIDLLDEKARALASFINSKISGDRAKAVSCHDNVLKDMIADADIVVNASPCGMKKDDTIPFDISTLKRGKTVYDLVYSPPETKLLKAAAKKGCKTFNGLGMLLHQGCRAFEIWTGKKAPVKVMEKALRKQVYGR